MFTKTMGFIKISKNMLYCDKFVNLSNSAKILLLYLLAFSNSVRNTNFFIKKEELKCYLNVSRATFWRLKNELKQLNIKISSKNNKYNFEIGLLYKNFPELSSQSHK